MSTDQIDISLANSNIDRQNMLNNPYSIAEHDKIIDISGGMAGYDFNKDIIMQEERDSVQLQLIHALDVS